MSWLCLHREKWGFLVIARVWGPSPVWKMGESKAETSVTLEANVVILGNYNKVMATYNCSQYSFVCLASAWLYLEFICTILLCKLADGLRFFQPALCVCWFLERKNLQTILISRFLSPPGSPSGRICSLETFYLWPFPSSLHCGPWPLDPCILTPKIRPHVPQPGWMKKPSCHFSVSLQHIIAFLSLLCSKVAQSKGF